MTRLVLPQKNVGLITGKQFFDHIKRIKRIQAAKQSFFSTNTEKNCFIKFNIIYDHKKNSQQTKNRREISKFSKITVNCLQDTLKAFLENRNKTRMPIMTTSIQHCTGGPRQCNQTRKRKKRCEEQKEESVPACRWYNYIHRKSKSIYKLL